MFASQRLGQILKRGGAAQAVVYQLILLQGSLQLRDADRRGDDADSLRKARLLLGEPMARRRIRQHDEMIPCLLWRLFSHRGIVCECLANLAGNGGIRGSGKHAPCRGNGGRARGDTSPRGRADGTDLVKVQRTGNEPLRPLLVCPGGGDGLPPTTERESSQQVLAKSEDWDSDDDQHAEGDIDGEKPDGR